MSKRSGKPPSDPILAAKSILDQVTGDEPRLVAPEKNPAAVALGRRGGLKGGPARKAALSPEQLKESARQAARARWGTKDDG
uniref:Histone H1 n=1 Tax=mine drainage metagenome TaxID=410659 RepID=E6Q1A9_9ZZZZ